MSCSPRLKVTVKTRLAYESFLHRCAFVTFLEWGWSLTQDLGLYCLFQCEVPLCWIVSPLTACETRVACLQCGISSSCNARNHSQNSALRTAFPVPEADGEGVGTARAHRQAGRHKYRPTNKQIDRLTWPLLQQFDERLWSNSDHSWRHAARSYEFVSHENSFERRFRMSQLIPDLIV